MNRAGKRSADANNGGQRDKAVGRWDGIREWGFGIGRRHAIGRGRDEEPTAAGVRVAHALEPGDGMLRPFDDHVLQ